jgi:hypothetical protein
MEKENRISGEENVNHITIYSVLSIDRKALFFIICFEFNLALIQGLRSNVI